MSAPVTRVASETSMSDVTVDLQMETVDVVDKPRGAITRPLLRPMSEVYSNLTDFSNFLDRSSSDSDGNFPMSDSDDRSPVSQLGDNYGWNSEWDRRNATDRRMGSVIGSKQAGKRIGKASLLQRVLSVGKVTAVSRRAGFAG